MDDKRLYLALTKDCLLKACKNEFARRFVGRLFEKALKEDITKKSK